MKIKKREEDLYDLLFEGKVLKSSLTEKEVAVLYAALKGDLEDGHIEIVGNYSQAVSYERGTSTVRDQSQAISYNDGKSTGGEHSQAVSYDEGISIGGEFSQAISYDAGQSTAGNMSQAICRYEGKAEAGECSQVMGGRGSHVKGGTGSALVAMDEEGRNAVGIVGENGIKPDTWYKAEDGKLVEA